MGARELIVKNKGYLILNLFVISLSLINYDSKLVKFIFSSYSATYGIEIVRYPVIFSQVMAGIILLMSLLHILNPLRWIKRTLVIFLFIWGYFMQTTAFNGMDNSIDVGWSFIKFRNCKGINIINEVEIGSCFPLVDPYLRRELTEVLKEVR
ncbi:MAG: hypothetical protein OEW75_11395 [Cyclobacteriaceae bacterium]|nr:hypothetical protein [Cyclobacteriaceae bacterium]